MTARWTIVLASAIGGLSFGFLGGVVLGGAAYLILSLTFPASVNMRAPKP
jgi:hypothetical protein